MPVHPQCQALLDQMAAVGFDMTAMPAAVSRQMADAGAVMAAAMAPKVDLAAVENLTCDGPDGPLRLRRYRPHGDGPLPGIVFFHGGGFVIGNLDTHDAVCRHLAHRVGAVVVAVDYRLAPEHVFPAAWEDCYAATVWVAAKAADLDIDPRRLAVCGDSAGGNLAAAVALMAAERGGPALSFQALVYPGIARDHSPYPSAVENAEGYLLTKELMDWFDAQYGPDGHGLPEDDWRGQPLLAPSHAGLPPALVITAEYDPLRDEGEAYAATLAAAGVPATATRYPGMIHAFWSYPGIIDAALEATDEIATALRAHWGS